jgi:hypothetical protein
LVSPPDSPLKTAPKPATATKAAKLLPQAQVDAFV